MSRHLSLNSKYFSSVLLIIIIFLLSVCIKYDFVQYIFSKEHQFNQLIKRNYPKYKLTKSLYWWNENNLIIEKNFSDYKKEYIVIVHNEKSQESHFYNEEFILTKKRKGLLMTEYHLNGNKKFEQITSGNGYYDRVWYNEKGNETTRDKNNIMPSSSH